MTPETMLTIRDYLAQHGGNPDDTRYRQALGNVATLLSKKQSIAYEAVPDPEFGTVNAYPEDLLAAAVAQAPTVEAAAAVTRRPRIPPPPRKPKAPKVKQPKAQKQQKPAPKAQAVKAEPTKPTIIVKKRRIALAP